MSDHISPFYDAKVDKDFRLPKRLGNTKKWTLKDVELLLKGIQVWCETMNPPGTEITRLAMSMCIAERRMCLPRLQMLLADVHSQMTTHLMIEATLLNCDLMKEENDAQKS